MITHATYAIAAAITLAFTGCAAARERPVPIDAFRAVTANATSVLQEGRGLASSITQTGAGNSAGVQQFGRNNSATIAQTGDNNTACLIQFGRNLSGEIVQTGGQSNGLLQTRRGEVAIPAELCASGQPVRAAIFARTAFEEPSVERPERPERMLRRGGRGRWQGEP